MIDPRNSSYRDIQAELKANGINAKGGHQELIERLEKFYAQRLTEDPAPVPQIIVDTQHVQQEAEKLESQGIIEKKVFTARGPQTIDGFPIDEVLDEMNAIFAGGAQARYDENNPTMIEFHGGPLIRQETTINQSKAAALEFARRYANSLRWPGREALGVSSAIGGTH